MIVISFWFCNRWSQSSCSVFNIIHLRAKLEPRSSLQASIRAHVGHRLSCASLWDCDIESENLRGRSAGRCGDCPGIARGFVSASRCLHRLTRDLVKNPITFQEIITTGPRVSVSFQWKIWLRSSGLAMTAGSSVIRLSFGVAALDFGLAQLLQSPMVALRR
jgi:hypothetical protein